MSEYEKELARKRMNSGNVSVLRAEIERLTRRAEAYQRELAECEQIAGRELGYPRYADDQKNFPGATDADGVCIGEHVTVTIVQELANHAKQVKSERDEARDHMRAQADRYARLTHENGRLRAALRNFADETQWSDRVGCLQWMGKRHAIEFAQSVINEQSASPLGTASPPNGEVVSGPDGSSNSIGRMMKPAIVSDRDRE